MIMLVDGPKKHISVLKSNYYYYYVVITNHLWTLHASCSSHRHRVILKAHFQQCYPMLNEYMKTPLSRSVTRTLCRTPKQ